jgi:outer membrane protein insertion porin family
MSGTAIASEMEVKNIRVEGLYSIDEDELLYMLGIENGVELSREDLKRGIKRAFMKGIFEDISVETEEENGGLLIVRVRERDFIKKIRVEGAISVEPAFIRKYLGLDSGDMVRYDLLESYGGNVLEALRQAGYPDASVMIEVKKTRRPHRVKLIVNIYEGRPLYIREILVLGRPSEEVLQYMRISENSVYNQFKLNEAIEKLAAFYRKSGYINPVVGPYTFFDGTLYLNVNPGKKLIVEVKGNDSLGDKKLIRGMPFFDARDIREDLIDEAVARMTAAYHVKGYPYVQIATVMSGEGDTVVLNFFVYEGPRVKVKGVNITGTTMPEDNLKRVMSLGENSLYNPDLLDNDVRAIRDFYNSLGYIDVSVSKPEVVVELFEATINISVNEGFQTVLANLNLQGVNAIPEEDIYSVLELEQGAPYNEVDISDARRRIIGLYREQGFLSAEVEVKRIFSVAGRADVTFKVKEGTKLYFGKTLVRGNASTKLRVIKRGLVHKEGEPLNKARLHEARQQIYKTGIFSEVDIDVLDKYDSKADIMVDVKEGKAGTFEFGLGYAEYDRFRGFFDISYKNLSGLNRSGSFRTEISSLMRRYIFRYNEPWFLEKRMPLRAYFINEDRKEINIDTGDVKYRVDRYTAGVGIEKEISEKTKFDLLYEYSFTETTDVVSDIILSREDMGTLGISSITPSLSYDTRDNPFDPKRGLYAGVSLKTATIVLLSETDFFKLVAFASGFKELNRSVVLAASVRGGLAQGIRDTTDLPLVERFFLGGRSTVRGFKQDNLGPKGLQGTPIGGNVFLLGNLELRFSLTNKWRIVTFFDTGSVWLDGEDVDAADLRYTAGAGIQYNTPVGPIRFDYGRKLDREEGESGGEFHFSIGHAF